jgi:integrase
MRTLRMILAAAAPRFGINNPSKGIDLYSEANRPTYSYEEPNSLTAEELPAFLQTYFEMYPQHYALAFLGFVTGLRPSMLVPLRRKGPKADVLWDENAILIRRSYTEGDESDVMDMTKSGARYRIGLPEQSMAVLRWHVATQIAPGPQEESDLLFPSTLGTLRHGETLQKPFAKVAKACGFKKHISPKAMRRTFQDLCRAAEVEGVVTRSISGHATSAMTEWYSTVHADEQRAAVGKVLSLFDRVRVPGETAPGVGSGVGSKLPTPKTG